MLNRKNVWTVLPLVAALGCADASDAPISSNTDHDTPDDTVAADDHAHGDDVQHAHDDEPTAYGDEGAAPDVVRERVPADAGTKVSKPTASVRDAAAGRASERPLSVDAGSDARVATPMPAPSAGVEGTPPAFDAGAGVLQPDGKTVVYRIPNGTGNKDWNQRDNPIRIKRGMTLRLIDDDKTAKGGGHWLHSFSICPHSRRAIGTGYECTIPASAKTGLQSGLFEHNAANAGGRIYLVVVD